MSLLKLITTNSLNQSVVANFRKKCSKPIVGCDITLNGSGCK